MFFYWYFIFFFENYDGCDFYYYVCGGLELIFVVDYDDYGWVV